MSVISFLYLIRLASTWRCGFPVPPLPTSPPAWLGGERYLGAKARLRLETFQPLFLFSCDMSHDVSSWFRCVFSPDHGHTVEFSSFFVVAISSPYRARDMSRLDAPPLFCLQGAALLFFSEGSPILLIGRAETPSFFAARSAGIPHAFRSSSGEFCL